MFAAHALAAEVGFASWAGMADDCRCSDRGSCRVRRGYGPGRSAWHAGERPRDSRAARAVSGAARACRFSRDYGTDRVDDSGLEAGGPRPAATPPGTPGPGASADPPDSGCAVTPHAFITKWRAAARSLVVPSSPRAPEPNSTTSAGLQCCRAANRRISPSISKGACWENLPSTRTNGRRQRAVNPPRCRPRRPRGRGDPGAVLGVEVVRSVRRTVVLHLPRAMR